MNTHLILKELVGRDVAGIVLDFLMPAKYEIVAQKRKVVFHVATLFYKMAHYKREGYDVEYYHVFDKTREMLFRGHWTISKDESLPAGMRINTDLLDPSAPEPQYDLETDHWYDELERFKAL